jgi:hypothetical protein
LHYLVRPVAAQCLITVLDRCRALRGNLRRLPPRGDVAGPTYSAPRLTALNPLTINGFRGGSHEATGKAMNPSL